jgi:predicted dehydrogenase
LIAGGFLGEGPVHMESYYGYEIAKTGYAGALLGDKQHWVRRLPGKLLHNIISHGIARIAEFLITDSPEVIAYGFTSPQLRSIGESEIIDELRVIIAEEQRATAYFTFSSQMRPSLHQFRVYGSKNGLILDQDQETLVNLRGKKFKSYAETFVAPVVMADQYLKGVFTNLRIFAACDFHMKSGMKYLIEAFYRAIADGAPDPIPSHEILRTARIMDKIFAQLNASADGASAERELSALV